MKTSSYSPPTIPKYQKGVPGNLLPLYTEGEIAAQEKLPQGTIDKTIELLSTLKKVPNRLWLYFAVKENNRALGVRTHFVNENYNKVYNYYFTKAYNDMLYRLSKEVIEIMENKAFSIVDKQNKLGVMNIRASYARALALVKNYNVVYNNNGL